MAAVTHRQTPPSVRPMSPFDPIVPFYVTFDPLVNISWTVTGVICCSVAPQGVGGARPLIHLSFCQEPSLGRSINKAVYLISVNDGRRCRFGHAGETQAVSRGYGSGFPLMRAPAWWSGVLGVGGLTNRSITGKV